MYVCVGGVCVGGGGGVSVWGGVWVRVCMRACCMRACVLRECVCACVSACLCVCACVSETERGVYGECKLTTK